ncbi:vesicle-associated membrane protein 5-like isoform X2 [Scyliorhinus torazame]|uniref:vesicle-associated membrane protein 5-like isoform X2 n=1 Tax=Scyliorhinus torazame TaxID=75743 RepID=UPI003B5982E5
MGTNNSDIIRKLQKDADDVMEVMITNVDKVKERGEQLEVLGDRAEQLLEAGKVFQKTAKEVERKERCGNVKWKIILGVTAGLVILVIIIVMICILTSTKSADSVPSIKSVDSVPSSTTVRTVD